MYIMFRKLPIDIVKLIMDCSAFVNKAIGI